MAHRDVWIRLCGGGGWRHASYTAGCDVVPSYAPYLGRPPLIMHYGSDYTLGKTYFNKMAHQQLMLETC